jgi:hypothetical protein
MRMYGLPGWGAVSRLMSLGILGLTACLLLPSSAQAVPSFARQTGLACEACHTVYPELTPFGRRFKLNGYVMSTRSGISDTNIAKNSTLSIQDLPPLSIMAQVSTTWTAKAIPDSTSSTTLASQNGTTEFPQQLSLFYAGRVAENMGAFFQVTYQQESGKFGIDNSDIRFANHSDDNVWVYGLSLNNNPTVQDVWNSTPGWGFPFYNAPGVAPAPAAKPLMTTLGGNVGGIGAYVFYNDALYLEMSVYRSAIQGYAHAFDSATGSPIIENFAPYWRAAYEYAWQRHNLSVGTFGMFAKYEPTNSTTLQGLNPGSPDTYFDKGLDLQYQYLGENNNFSIQSNYIREDIDHNLSAPNPTASAATTSLNRWQTNANYYWHRKYGGSVGFSKSTGTADPTLYASGTVLTGSSKHKPDSQFETVELDYMPWLNTKILAQYTIYNQFNGGSGDYDGSGLKRKASDNNTAMLAMWFSF